MLLIVGELLHGPGAKASVRHRLTRLMKLADLVQAAAEGSSGPRTGRAGYGVAEVRA